MKDPSFADLEADRINLFQHAETVRVFGTAQERQLPVTLVTGFLGSGKTTLLQHILSNQSNLRVAAAINDFASLNIDERLIRHHSTMNEETSTSLNGTNKNSKPTKIVELSNGCVCCHLMDDLKEAVWQLLSNDTTILDEVNYLVIETSGVSDPAAIIRTLDAKFGKCFRARLDSVVTVVDADDLLQTLSLGGTGAELEEENGDIGSRNDQEGSGKTINNNAKIQKLSQAAVAQLNCADVILLNKIDLLPHPTSQNLDTLTKYIRTINPHAVIHQTNHCHVPLEAILDVQIPHNSSQAASETPITHEASQIPIYVSQTGGALRSAASSMENSKSSLPKHLQTDQFTSVACSHAETPLSLSKLQHFLTTQLFPNISRMKGILWIDTPLLRQYRCVVHWSGRGRLGFALDGAWTGPPHSEIVFIGRASNMNAMQLQLVFSLCYTTNNNECVSNDTSLVPSKGLDLLQQNPEFVLVPNPANDSATRTTIYFRLTGSAVYGYSEEEIARDLRIDTNAMNVDLVDAVNASVDAPKAFLAYGMTEDGRVMLICPRHDEEPANNFEVLLREAKAVLATYFRNVQVCKCGA